MKRAGFNHFGLPVMLLLPQLIIIGVFFYWLSGLRPAVVILSRGPVRVRLDIRRNRQLH